MNCSGSPRPGVRRRLEHRHLRSRGRRRQAANWYSTALRRLRPVLHGPERRCSRPATATPTTQRRATDSANPPTVGRAVVRVGRAADPETTTGAATPDDAAPADPTLLPVTRAGAGCLPPLTCDRSRRVAVERPATRHIRRGRNAQYLLGRLSSGQNVTDASPHGQRDREWVGNLTRLAVFRAWAAFTAGTSQGRRHHAGRAVLSPPTSTPRSRRHHRILGSLPGDATAGNQLKWRPALSLRSRPRIRDLTALAPSGARRSHRRSHRHRLVLVYALYLLPPAGLVMIATWRRGGVYACLSLAARSGSP